SDYWLAFMSNFYPPTDPSFDTTLLQLLITSEANASGTVEVPGIAFSADFTVAAGDLAIIEVPADTMVAESENGVPVEKGIHVSADNEVTVHALNMQNTTTADAYAALPVEALGTEYLVLGYQTADLSTQAELA